MDKSLTVGTPDDIASHLATLESAEEFFEYLGVVYDPDVLEHCRLHVLQRFHDYLEHGGDAQVSAFDRYRDCLLRAYDDFLRSGVLEEKVFRVFKRAAGIATVPVSAIGRARH